MDRLRLTPQAGTDLRTLCCRCQAGAHPWDRISGQPYCPQCQESLALGESPPLVLRTEPQRCAVCARRGTIRFLTLPQNSRGAVEMDLCGEHLRGLIGRRLGPHAFLQLRRQLRGVRLEPDEIFLLHGEFYDRDGKALRPALESE